MRRRTTGYSSRRRDRPSRAGYGILLVLVLAILLVLAVVGVGHGFFSTSVSEMTQLAARGDVAVDLAANGLAEAHFLLARSVNTPGSAFYDRFRNQTGDFSFDVPLKDLPHLAQELKEAKHYALEDGAVHGEVQGQHPSSPANPTEHERQGRLYLSASIVHTGLGVVRRLGYSYDLKVCLSVPARPLDRPTLFVADARPLVTTFADANDTINRSIARLAELLTAIGNVKAEFQKLMEKAKQDPASSSFVGQLQVVITRLQAIEQGWPRITVSSGTTRGVADQLHLFPADAFALTTEGARVDLTAVNLPPRIRTRITTIQTRETEQQTSYQAFVDAVKNLSSSNSSQVMTAFQDWTTKLEALVAEYKALLITDYKAFQDSFDELAGGALDPYRKALASLTGQDEAMRSTAVIYDVDAHRSGDVRNLATKFAQLLDRGPAFSGRLFVVNSNEELVIDRTFKGRIVIVVNGNAVIQRALVDQPGTDNVVIVGLGRLAVEGPVQGNVIAVGPLTMEPEAAITGNLVVTRPDYVSITPERVLAGSVTRNEALVAGPATGDGSLSSVGPGFLYVAVGPSPVQVSTERK